MNDKSKPPHRPAPHRADRPSTVHGAEPVTVSVICCTVGGAGRIERFVRQVKTAARAHAHQVEVVVVDNSVDGSLAGFADESVRTVRAPYAGLSRARQVGCSLAVGDVLVFVDDDVLFDEDWLNRMVQPISSGTADIVASRIQLSNEIDQLGLPRLFRAWLAENLNDIEDIQLVGAGMAFRRSMLQFGVWDPNLGKGPVSSGYGEEQLFGDMCRKAGARLELADLPAITHSPDLTRLTVDMFLEEALRKGASEAYISHHWLGEAINWGRLRSLLRRFRAWKAVRRLGGSLDDDAAVAMEAVQLAAWTQAMTELRSSPRAYVQRESVVPGTDEPSTA